jgi:hypothetical protein
LLARHVHRRQDCQASCARRDRYLSAQLREAVPYLKDAGWHETASLLAAADDIERMQARLTTVEENPHLDCCPQKDRRTCAARMRRTQGWCQ